MHHWYQQYQGANSPTVSTTPATKLLLVVKGLCHKIFTSDVFHESSSPKPLKVTLGSFRIFQKFAEIFTSQGAPLVSTTPAELVAKFSAYGVDTGGKFAPGVVDTSSNFATGVVDTAGKFAPGIFDTSGAP